MIDHVSIHVTDLGKARDFYVQALAPLGYTMTAEYTEWQVAGFGVGGKADFWIKADGADQTNHVAFAANDKASVDAFHAASIAAGGKDNGSPGYRKEYTPGYYAAFILDMEGHNIEVVFHDPNPSE